MNRLAAVLLLASASVWGQSDTFPEDPGQSLYRVQTVRAAPGELGPLIDAYKTLYRPDSELPEGLHRPHIIRHSQGDHWDLMLVFPVTSIAGHFKAANTAGHRRALAGIESRLAFSEDHVMRGPAHELVARRFAGHGFAHIEVFHALPGRKDDLVEQRKMENAYMRGIGKAPNLVFVSEFGGDADAMTIGLYDSIQHFAAPSEMNDEQRDRVAREAGFAGLDGIGLYLRRLIARHQDTLGNVIAR